MSHNSVHAFDDELARLDATATAEAVRRGELSPAETVAAAIERARRVNPSINAIVTEDFDRATRTASARGYDPFAGVPTFIKDMTDAEGFPTKSGSRAFETIGPAKKNGELVDQIFDMGMTCLGKSSLPEFGFTASTEFPDADPTRNPWNLDRSTGGSSGGAAALVASGVVPIAHGGDGGGSIRIPAAVNGLVGLKVTRARLIQSRQSKMLPVDISVEGMLTRTVRDTALFFAEAERRHRNPKLAPIGLVTEPLTRRLRIGLIAEPPIDIEIDEPTKRVLAETVTRLEALGHTVVPMEMPVSAQFAEDFTHYWAMLAHAVSIAGDRLFDPSFDKAGLSELTLGLSRRFRSRLGQTPGALYRLRRSAADHVKVFTNLDLILSPTLAHVTPEIGYLGLTQSFEDLFKRVEGWVGFTPLANATGAPSITLPLGFDEPTNTPIGMMFGAAHGQEALLLELALQLEEAHPWPRMDQAKEHSWLV